MRAFSFIIRHVSILRICGGILIAVGILRAYVGASAAEKTSASSMGWQLDLQAPGVDYGLGAAAFEGGSFNVVITGLTCARPKCSNGEFRIWRVSEGGKDGGSAVIKKADKSRILAPVNPSMIMDMAASDEQVFVAGKLDGEEPAIFTLTPQGQQIAAVRLPAQLRDAHILRLLVDSGGLIVLGRHWLPESKLDAIAFKLNSEGTIVWQSRMDRGRQEAAVDGVLAHDGGVIMVGTSGEYSQMDFGPSDVWLATLDSRGNVTAERTFPGRRPQLCRVTDGSILVLYDDGKDQRVNYKLKKFDSTLTVLWDRPLASADFGLEPWRITAVPEDGVVVVGCAAIGTEPSKAELWFYQLDGQGKLIARTSLGRTYLPFARPQILNAHDKAIVIWQSASYTERGDSYIIKLAAIELRAPPRKYP